MRPFARRWLLRIGTLGCSALALGICASATDAHTPVARAAVRLQSAKGAGGVVAVPPTSPSGPPLVSGESAFATPSSRGGGRREAGEGGELEREAGSPGGEPLVENGLSSPLCTSSTAALSATTKSNCASSGFVASAAPAANYGFDVNIDSGPEGSIAAYFQDFLVKPPWSLLVWIVQSLLVGVEWSYTINLLSSPQMHTVAVALRSLEHAFTQPLLALALAFAGGGLAWRGLVKRRHSASLAEALAILAMVIAGLAMTLDPLGTVGSVARFADETSIGTLATVVHGSPSSPDRTLADSATQVFGSSVLGPWCFMEFGNVAWCDEPRHLDPQLRAAAIALAAHDEREAARSGRQQASGLAVSAALLRRAKTNGAIFLAQPANGPARNASNEDSSLFHAICDGPSATQCHGPAASEAEFRTSGFTIDRLIGLMMIWLGALGLILLLGFVVLRLLGAAVLSLVLLLCAPAAVLMPTIGESGRAAFRRWAGRLLAAVTAKLVWSLLLGVVLVSLKIVLTLGGFGWWVRWLLMSTLWWLAFHNRHRVLSFAGGSEPARSGSPARGIAAIGRSVARRRWPLPWRGPRFQPARGPAEAGGIGTSRISAVATGVRKARGSAEAGGIGTAGAASDASKQ